MKTRLISLLSILTGTICFPMSDHHSVAPYAAAMHEMNFNVAFPSEMVEYNDSMPVHVFHFGTTSDPTIPEPVFEGGAVIHLSDGCHAVLMHTAQHPVQPTKMFPGTWDIGQQQDVFPVWRMHHSPSIDGWMLYNCGLPWVRDNLNRLVPRGVIMDRVWNHPREKELSDISDTVYRHVLQKVNAQRDANAQVIRSPELLHKMHCTRIYSVRLPHFDLVRCQDEDLDSRLKQGNDCCYGVELFKSTSPAGITMLFFFDSTKGKTVADYLDMLSPYMAFE